MKNINIFEAQNAVNEASEALKLASADFTGKSNQYHDCLDLAVKAKRELSRIRADANAADAANTVSVEKAGKIVSGLKVRIKRTKKPETIAELETKLSEAEKALSDAENYALERSKAEKAFITKAEKALEKADKALAEAQEAKETASLHLKECREKSESLNAELLVAEELATIKAEAEKRAKLLRDKLAEDKGVKTTAEDESQTLEDLGDNDFGSLVSALQSGEQSAEKLNRALNVALDRLKAGGAMSDIKCILLLVARQTTEGNGFWDKSLAQMKTYVKTFSPFDVVIREVKTDNGKVWKCRLHQKRDTDFYPERPVHFWDKVQKGGGGKKPLTHDKEMKRIADTELSDDTTEAQLLEQLQAYAEKRGLGWAVNFADLEKRLIEQINAA